jgi:hypothetical protein
MIPRRMLSNEVSGSGLRQRVTACRKRARVNRVSHRQAQSLNEASELFPETVPTVRIGSTDVHATHASPVPPTRAHYEGGERDDSQAVRVTEEQEVGIT